MPRRYKRRFKRRRFNRRFRSRRYKRFTRRRFKRNSDSIVYVKFTVPTFITLGSGVGQIDHQFFAKAYDLNDINSAQVGPYIDNYQEYRIRAIKECWYFPPNSNDQWFRDQTGSYNPRQFLWVTAIDHDDESAPTGLEYFEQSNSSKWNVLPSGNGKKITRYFKPVVLGMLYETSTNTGYGPISRKRWVSTQDPNVQYFGLKYGWVSDHLLQTGDFIVGVQIITYYVQFRRKQPK